MFASTACDGPEAQQSGLITGKLLEKIAIAIISFNSNFQTATEGCGPGIVIDIVIATDI